ncbi:hypothetical protein JW865_08315 [Candidatus Bathyarchaeota archaeon]|nr:hypothetical protein [Candidatus Bathyarchaeota archaeon]
MITKIGIKKSLKELVAYEEVKKGENELIALARLTTVVESTGLKPRDPGMIMFLDDKDVHDCRKEVMMPIDRVVEGLKTKIIPEMRAGFLVFQRNNEPLEKYYEELLKYIKDQGLEPKVDSICTSIEAIFQPDTYSYTTMDFIDEDKQDIYEIEIIIPIED